MTLIFVSFDAIIKVKMIQICCKFQRHYYGEMQRNSILFAIFQPVIKLKIELITIWVKMKYFLRFLTLLLGWKWHTFFVTFNAVITVKMMPFSDFPYYC